MKKKPPAEERLGALTFMTEPYEKTQGAKSLLHRYMLGMKFFSSGNALPITVCGHGIARS